MHDHTVDEYQKRVEVIGNAIEDVYREGRFDSQVLNLAAFRGSTTDVEAFIALGADTNAVGDLGLTPLHYAVLGGHAEIVALLTARGAQGDKRNELGEPPCKWRI